MAPAGENSTNKCTSLVIAKVHIYVDPLSRPKTDSVEVYYWRQLELHTTPSTDSEKR